MAVVPLWKDSFRASVLKDGYLPRIVSIPGEPADLGDVAMWKDSLLASLHVRVVADEKPWPGELRIRRTGPPMDSKEFIELAGGIPARAAWDLQEYLSRHGGLRDEGWRIAGSEWKGERLPPGNYLIVAGLPDGGACRKEVALRGKDIEVFLPLADGPMVDIRRGPWSSDVEVCLIPADSIYGLLRTNGDRLRQVPPGSYSVGLRFPGGDLPLKENFVVEEGTNPLLDLSGVELGKCLVRGRIVCMEGGAPVPVADSLVMFAGRPPGLEVRTDAEGVFEIQGARTGAYRILGVAGHQFEIKDPRDPPRRGFAVPATPPDILDVGDFQVLSAPGGTGGRVTRW